MSEFASRLWGGGRDAIHRPAGRGQYKGYGLGPPVLGAWRERRQSFRGARLRRAGAVGGQRRDG